MRPIAIDATTLSIMLNPKARIPLDPTTQMAVDLGRKRLLGFIAQAEKDRRKLVIPTPATAELLTAIGPTSADYIRVVNRKAVFEVRSFDDVAAVELAFLNRDVFGSLDQKNGLESGSCSMFVCRNSNAEPLNGALAGVAPSSLTDRDARKRTQGECLLRVESERSRHSSCD